MILPGLRIGAAVGHGSVDSGTLGAFASDEKTGRLGILSNTHVLAGIGGGIGDNIKMVHNGTVTDVGKLARMIALKDPCDGDAAFAWIDYEPEDVSAIASPMRTIRLSGEVIDPEAGMRVWKLGRKTKMTEGVVFAASVPPVKIAYGEDVCTLANLIAIKPVDDDAFSAAGDSGSLVVTAGGDALGIIVGGKAVEPELQGYSLVNPLGRALKLLKVKLIH
jgi:hypothetical protein